MAFCPCRLCPYVVIVVGLVCVNDPWGYAGYAVEPLMSGAEIRFQDASAHQTCLCKQTSDGVTLEEDPTSIKKAKLELVRREGTTVCQGHGNHSNETPWTWQQGQLQEQAGFLSVEV